MTSIASAVSTTPIVALDVPTAADALAIVDRLGERCGFYKIGLELFSSEGPQVVRAVLDRGADVFLDLKLHDIPNTVRGAVRSAARLGARLLTVHASGGSAMLAAATEAAGENIGILAVTVLTSLDEAAVGEAWGKPAIDVGDEVLRLSGLASAAGAHGVVCSGREAGRVRERFGGRLAVLVPGVRLTGGAAHDQARTVTPSEAMRAGARYVVVGRAVTAASDPIAAIDEVRRELDARPRV